MSHSLDGTRPTPLPIRARVFAGVAVAQQVAAAADAALTRSRLRVYPSLMLAMGTVFYLASIVTGHPPFDAFGHPVAIDLSNRVTAGRLALDGALAQLYDVRLQWTVQQQILGPGHPEFLDIYVSPPFVAYFFAPLAAIPYELAAIVWTTLTIALLIADIRLFWPLLPNLQPIGFRIVLLGLLSSWPVLELVADGQDGAIALLVLLGSLHLLLRRRDLAGGAVLGLGVFKPQLFLLMPVLLACQHRWRALAGWLAVAASLTLASIAMLGSNEVTTYLALITSNGLHQAIFDSLNWKMQSLLALAGALLGSVSQAAVIAVTISGDALIVFGFVRAIRHQTETPQQFTFLYALAILAGAIVSPYFFLYDCVILFIPALVLLDRAPRDRTVRLSIAAAYVLTWTTPIRYLAFGHLGWPLPVLAAPWTAVALIVLLRRSRRWAEQL